MNRLITPLALLSLICTSALFGFFYAWVCSTMWGLDAADPRVAIAAMQTMNASVRNTVFAPGFFGTSVILMLTTCALLRNSQRQATSWFAIATALVACLSFGLTIAVNIPMNEVLAEIIIPNDAVTARILWQDYSPDWQFWNQMRTIATGIAVTCIGIGLLKIGKANH